MRDICTAHGVLCSWLTRSSRGLGRTSENLRLRSRRCRPDVLHSRQGAGGGDICRSRRSSRRGTSGRAPYPANMAAPTAAIRSPVRCRIAVVDLFSTSEYQAAAAVRGAPTGRSPRPTLSATVSSRSASRGLWAGVDIDPSIGTGRAGLRSAYAARCAGERHRTGSTVRLAPPLVVSADDVDLAADALGSSCCRPEALSRANRYGVQTTPTHWGDVALPCARLPPRSCVPAPNDVDAHVPGVVDRLHGLQRTAWHIEVHAIAEVLLRRSNWPRSSSMAGRCLAGDRSSCR